MTGEARLEPAALAHTAVLAALHGQCFEDAWSARAMAEVLGSAGAFASLAFVGAEGHPVGFALARVTGDEAELLSLGVLPRWRRRGIARVLLDDIKRRARHVGARRIFLEVAESNEAARGLYGAGGFVAVGRRPDYYRAPNAVPVAALTLRCALIPGLSD